MLRVKSYIDDMRNAFGGHFLILLFLVQCLLKGLVFIIMTTGMLPLFKSMGIDAVTLQRYGAIAMSPWTLKPAIGLLSDFFPLGGYHKRWYMLGSVALGVGGVAMMVTSIRVPVLIVLFVFFTHMCISVCDLLTEAAYARLMREPEGAKTGSAIVTLVQGYQQVGFLLALSFMGVLADHQLFSVAYGIALMCIMTPILPLLAGWLPERRRQLWEKGLRRFKRCQRFLMMDRDLIRREWKVFVLVASTGLAGPILSLITAFGNEVVGLVGAILVLGGVTVASFYVFPPVIARVALYQVLTQVSRISVGSALDYFFTADATCLPGGPNFNYTFYVTWTGLLGAAISLCTVFIYQLLFNKWRYRSVLIFTSALSGCGGIFDYIMTMRWNVAWGIPDRYFYVLGDGIIHNLVDMLYWIPSSSIIAKVCPPGMEAGIFSFLAGISNYGRMVSTLMGAQLIHLVGIQTVEPCYWKPLPWLILFGHISIMLMVSIPAAWLIPNMYQTDHPVQEEEEEEEEDEDIEMVEKEPTLEDYLECDFD